MNKLFAQIMKFGVVGIVATLLDYAVLALLTEVCGIYYLFSSFLSYSISLIFNYVASMRYVFAGKEDMSKIREFTIFLLLSVIGLGINQLGMWIMVEQFAVYYMISKIVVTGIVMVWNFITRKIFLEKH